MGCLATLRLSDPLRPRLLDCDYVDRNPSLAAPSSGLVLQVEADPCVSVCVCDCECVCWRVGATPPPLCLNTCR